MLFSPDKGPDGAKVPEMMKYWRKIPMTKPWFEPRNIEMKAGRFMTYFIRTLNQKQISTDCKPLRLF
jgi:hypothetical protein